jgi:predicted glycosyltransferase
MKILVEITHPAHVHFFHNATAEFERRGRQVAVTVRQKEVAVAILEDFQIPVVFHGSYSACKCSGSNVLLHLCCTIYTFCKVV